MNKLKMFLSSMFKIGLIGFGGGNALIPVIEKTALDEQKLITKDEYDEDVMIASITPGALPVEISAGIGRRLFGERGLLLGATAMALPGVIITIFMIVIMSKINEGLLEQVSIIALGVYSFICCLLIEYVIGTIKTEKDSHTRLYIVVVIILVTTLVCGKNLYRLLPGERFSLLSLSTIHIFAMAFFVIFYTRGRLNWTKIIVTSVCIMMFIMCNCKARIIDNTIVKGSLYFVMIVLGLNGFLIDFKGEDKEKDYKIKKTVRELLLCVIAVGIFAIPACFVTGETITFVKQGMISSVLSFGGGDAYLTVADGLFVNTNMITEDEFYSLLVPLVNVLPGSILCKTLSGVGYFIGLNHSGHIIGGIIVALVGFMTSVTASCGVFSIVSGIYDNFGSLDIFKLIKKWIRPIVSGLLVNVILSLFVQVKKMNTSQSNWTVYLGYVFIIYLVDELLRRKFKVKNEIVALISVLLSVVICNIC
ncbi:MAG: chromate transporter [Lachnospiraceae bacterium]|nr:chromate transporter [Lachnospiraceae bacterium]